MASGIASNNQILFNWAVQVSYPTLLQQIQQNSTLPSEATRGQRSSQYHAMAASGLTMMAYLAAANNVDLYSMGGYALRRLNLLVTK